MPQLTLTVTNFLFKLVTVLLVLFVGSLIRPFIYNGTWVMFTTALAVSIVSVLIDTTLLLKMGNVKTLALDFIVNTFLIAMVPSLWHGITISMIFALGCSFVISWFEFYVHRIMLRGERLVEDAR